MYCTYTCAVYKLCGKIQPLDNQTVPIASVFLLSQPLSGTWSMGKSDHKQFPSQQDEFKHHPNHHSSQHLQDHQHQHQQTVGGSSAGVLDQMRSLREKEAVVDEHLEGVVQRKRALEQLERVSGVSK